MKTKYLSGVVLAALLSGTALAKPTASVQLPGKLIANINSDKAYYTPTDYAHVSVALNNRTGADFNGALQLTVYGRGELVGTYQASASVASGATGTVNITVPPSSPAASWQGYLVDVRAVSGNNTLDEQSYALDMSSDYWTYPRQCWITSTWDDWGGYHNPNLVVPPEQQIRNLNAWHCNSYQLYDHAYRWHKGYQEGPSYVNGDKLRQQRDLTERNIIAAHKFGAGVFGYLPLYAVNVGLDPDFTHDGTGAKLAWGVFDSNCSGNTGGCAVADMWHFNQDIAYVNPNNTEWQNYWARMANEYATNLGLDGIFIDTYGTWEKAQWDYSGNRIIMDTAYSSFLRNVVPQINMPVTLNPAGSYNEQDLVSSGMIAWAFAERWNNSSDIGNFGAFLTKAQNIRTWAAKSTHDIGIDWDLGMNKSLMADPTCTFNGGTKTCTFNTPGVLYQEAAIGAVGAHHTWFVDGNQGDGSAIRAIGNDDYPIGNMPTWPASMIQAEWDYQNFIVAYEKLLRLNTVASPLAGMYVSSSEPSATFSLNDGPGVVWGFQTQRPGYDMINLLNHTQLNATQVSDVNDNCACAPAASTLKNIAVKMYYTPGGTLGRLHTASPDINHGVPFQLGYTTGSDGSGSYISFTVPSLTYWSFVWLDNGTAGSDYVTP